MADRDGEYCFSVVMFVLNFCVSKSVNGQSFGCWIPYDVGNVVILNNVSFSVVEYYKEYMQYCKK